MTPLSPCGRMVTPDSGADNRVCAPDRFHWKRRGWLTMSNDFDYYDAHTGERVIGYYTSQDVAREGAEVVALPSWSVYSEAYANYEEWLGAGEPIDGSQEHVSTHATETEAEAEAGRLTALLHYGTGAMEHAHLRAERHAVTRPSTPPKPDYDVLAPSDTWPLYRRAAWGGEDHGRWLVFASRVVEGKDDEHYAWRVKAPGEFHWEMVPPHTTWEEAMEYVRQHIEKKQEQA